MPKYNTKKQKKVKLVYIAKTKRLFRGGIFPKKNANDNFLEINEEHLDTFLRMKVGGERLWNIEKEKIKKEAEVQ